MKKMTKLLSLVLALALCMLTLPAALAETATNENPADKVVVAIGSDPQDLLPCNYNTGDRKHVFNLIYQGLFYVPANDIFEPLIAKGYDVVDDLTWDVEIYDYVYDSEGNHITADDVVYSYDYLQTTGYAVKYDFYESVEKIDDYKVRFHWAKPLDAIGAVDFVLGSTIIFSQKAFEEGNFATNPVGTGRYKVDSFTSGSSVVCSINENYWQTDADLLAAEPRQAHVKTIELQVIPEKAQQIMALQTGTIDLVMDCPSTSVADFQEGGAYADNHSVIELATGMWYTLTPSEAEGKITADPNFRKAVFYALDNDVIAQAVGNAQGLKTLGTGTTLDVPAEWYDEETYVSVYDVDQAKDYLAQTSYNGESLILMGDNSATAKNALTVIQTMLQQAGINVGLSIVEANMLPNYCTDADSWDLYFTFYSSGLTNIVTGYNRILNRSEFGIDMSFGFIADDELDALFNAAFAKDTHNDETMTALKNYWIENAFHDPIFTTTQYFVASDKFAEVVFQDNSIVPNLGSSNYNVD